MTAALMLIAHPTHGDLLRRRRSEANIASNRGRRRGRCAGPGGATAAPRTPSRKHNARVRLDSAWRYEATTALVVARWCGGEQRSEQAMRLVSRSGREEELVGGSSGYAVAELQCPEALDLDRRSAGAVQHAAVLRLAVASHIALIGV